MRYRGTIQYAFGFGLHWNEQSKLLVAEVASFHGLEKLSLASGDVMTARVRSSEDLDAAFLALTHTVQISLFNEYLKASYPNLVMIPHGYIEHPYSGFGIIVASTYSLEGSRGDALEISQEEKTELFELLSRFYPHVSNNIVGWGKSSLISSV